MNSLASPADDGQGYAAPWWLPGGHAQTVWPILTRRVPLTVRRERFELPDGDFVNLDWVGDDGPIIVMLPGLQGDVKSPYVRGMLRQCQACGWRGVLLNLRGCGEPNRLPRNYHSGMTDDLHHFVRHLAKREPATPLAVVSFSIGANICMKWLGECGQRGERLPLRAAVGVSVPFHLGPVARHIEHGGSRLYQWYLLRSLRHDMRQKMRALDVGLDLRPEDLSSLDTFPKFDDRITAPLNGFDSADDYYTKTRSDVMLPHINVPTLIINARNDPIIPAHLIPRVEAVSKHVTIEITPTGGHVGFVTGRWPWRTHYWLDQRIATFIGERLASRVSK
jgi:predicted alpha/beta-fold hydrolase